MANLTLVYGMRLLPSDEVAEVGDATVKLKNGKDAHVTMHVLEGSKDDIGETVEDKPGSVLSISIRKYETRSLPSEQ